MRSFRSLLAAVIASTAGGQGAYSQSRTPVKYRKSHYRFRLLKSGVRLDTAVVRTDGVYVSEYRRQDCAYSFFRFLNDGRVFISGVYDRLPAGVELNDIRYGRHGQYRVDSNVITIESYWQNGRWRSRGYTRYYYRIDRDGVYFTATNDRSVGVRPIPTPGTDLKRNYFYPVKLEAIKPFWKLAAARQRVP